MVKDQEFLNAICRTNLEAYSCKAFSVLEPGTEFEYSWHIGAIAEHLMASFSGEIPDLIINIAPRTLKSVLVAQIFPAWGLGQQSHHQFIGASYAHTLAERNVMRTRQIINSEWNKMLFPETVISNDQNQKDYFTTTKAGQYKGTGIGGTITGFGCHTLIVDDPINPKEAVSDTIRVNAINEIRSTLFSRFNKYSERRFIMIMQRLHDDDPTGNLMRDGGYHLLKLPAVAPKSYVVNLGKKEWKVEAGDYLTTRLGPNDLDKLQNDLGAYHFAGQYMQEPVPIGGGEIKEEWFQFYHQGGIKPTEMNICILVDPSGGEETNKKKKKLSDFTAMFVIGFAPDNNYYVLDIIRDRLNPTERIDTLFMLHRKWNSLAKRPPKVGWERYGMMGDIHYINEKKKQDTYNFPLVELGGTMSKEDRIRRIIPDVQTGRWYLPHSLIYVDGEGRKFDLVQELLKGEVKSFPKSRFDDMLDCMTRAYDADLGMVFPKPKLGMVAKARRNSYNSEYKSFEDF